MGSTLLLAACQKEAADSPVTWHQDVAPIVSEHCGSCHTGAGIAPFALASYDDAAPLAAVMLAAIEDGTMPPWFAVETDECSPRLPFKDDTRLSEDEKQVIRDWVSAGALEGDPATAATLPESPSLEIDEPDIVAELPMAWTVEGERDEFICFVVDPGFTEAAWVTEVQFVPGNEKVAHHALVYHDVSGESLELAGDDGVYDCFGGIDTDGLLMATWTPGAAPMRTPPDAGMPVLAGSPIVVQMHYHPSPDGPETDLSSVQLKYTTEPPTYEAAQALLGNYSRLYDDGTGLQPGDDDSTEEPEFRIPAGAKGHIEELVYRQEIDLDFPLYNVGTHMHYVGTDMYIELRRPSPDDGEPESECLLQTPNWDFNWQRSYDYDADISEVPVISQGEELYMRCTYDNSLDNPAVRAALEEQGLSEPVDVYLGEETLDEMCLGLFGILAPRGLILPLFQ